MTDKPKLLIIDDARRDPLLFAELLNLIGYGEKEAQRILVLEQEPAFFPAIDPFGMEMKQRLADIEAETWKLQRARAPHDRGTGGRVRPKEGLAAMMARIAREVKPLWKTPELLEHWLCTNCDGAPDGGHVMDEFCRLRLEDE